MQLCVHVGTSKYIKILMLYLCYAFSYMDVGENMKDSRLVQLDDCTCLGYTQSYECSILGGGRTIWNGSAFDCPHNEIQLRHSQFMNSQATGECNNGTITASSIGVSEGFYSSRLNITVVQGIINETIECVHHNIINNEVTTIGHKILEITEGSH